MKNELPKDPITEALTDLVRYICKRPEDLKVREVMKVGVLHITLEASMLDMPSLIGRGGIIVKSFQALTARIGRQCGLSAQFHLVDSMEGDREERPSKPQVNPHFTTETVDALIDPIVTLAFGDDVEFETEWDDQDIRVTIGVMASETTTVIALNNILYAIGKKNGRDVNVKTKLSRNSVEAK